jgi:hypothetical protein
MSAFPQLSNADIDNIFILQSPKVEAACSGGWCSIPGAAASDNGIQITLF